MKNDWSIPYIGSSSSSGSSGSSYFVSQNRGGGNDSIPYYGSTTDAYDVRYADDPHKTYGKQYDDEERRYV